MLHELCNGDIWILYEGLQAGHNFTQVVWRDSGGDAHSYSCCTIHQQVRHPSRQHCWLILHVQNHNAQSLLIARLIHVNVGIPKDCFILMQEHPTTASCVGKSFTSLH